MAVEAAVESISKQAKKVSGTDDLRKVATVSANWNTDIGDGIEWSNAQEYPGYIKWTAMAYHMMINEVIYSLTH